MCEVGREVCAKFPLEIAEFALLTDVLIANPIRLVDHWWRLWQWTQL